MSKIIEINDLYSYYGGICAYSFCEISNCDCYGPFNGDPASFGGIYYIGGVTSRLENGNVTEETLKEYRRGEIDKKLGAEMTPEEQVALIMRRNAAIENLKKDLNL